MRMRNYSATVNSDIKRHNNDVARTLSAILFTIKKHKQTKDFLNFQLRF